MAEAEQQRAGALTTERKSTKQEHHANDTVISTGEKLDNLVAKSDNLSASSKMFYTQAKKQNSCCLVM
jgi:hypothetical protein